MVSYPAILPEPLPLVYVEGTGLPRLIHVVGLFHYEEWVDISELLFSN